MTAYQRLEVLIGIPIALLVTCLLLIAALAIRRPKMLQLDAAYRRFSPSGALPGRNRRLRLILLVLMMLIILNVVWLGLLLARARDERAAESTSTQSATPGGVWSSAGPSQASDPRNDSAEEKTIQVEDVADSTRPFQPVRIQGMYRGGANTFLRVQRWEKGKWLDFPIPTKTDHSGQFITYVELGQSGPYRLRVLDPNSGVTSKAFVLVIKD
jgi:hypothetical protein